MFEINKRIPKSLGRAGILTTFNGKMQTPAFVTVGTKATIKSLTPEQVKETGSQVVLANTYHLYLEPGEKIIKKSGGLHNFMAWKGPIMTDSGGFQAFSLGAAYGNKLSKFTSNESPKRSEVDFAYDEEREKKAKITDNGVEFRSIIDGSRHFFTPEKSIQIQKDLGADIIFAFDECTSPHAPKKYLIEAMERTHKWAERCLTAHEKFFRKTQKQNFDSSSLKGSHGTQNFTSKFSFGRGGNSDQYLFGIVQGGRHEDLRKKSAKVIGAMNFAGFGIGGSFVKEDMATAVKWVNEILPEEKPRHLLGVGEPIDMILGVENGCDTFDCVAPTRIARNGSLYTKFGRININNARYRNKLEPIEPSCGCYTCKNYTSAYVAHLFRAREMLAATLASIHNLYFLNNLMSQIRESILSGKFFQFKQKFLRNYKE